MPITPVGPSSGHYTPQGTPNEPKKGLKAKYERAKEKFGRIVEEKKAEWGQKIDAFKAERKAKSDAKKLKDAEKKVQKTATKAYKTAQGKPETDSESSYDFEIEQDKATRGQKTVFHADPMESSEETQGLYSIDLESEEDLPRSLPKDDNLKRK